MTDIEAWMAKVLQKHILVRYDRRAWWCQCGDDCLTTGGSHSSHVAAVLVKELGLKREPVPAEKVRG